MLEVFLLPLTRLHGLKHRYNFAVSPIHREIRRLELPRVNVMAEMESNSGLVRDWRSEFQLVYRGALVDVKGKKKAR
jgi:hypothetical protein